MGRNTLLEPGPLLDKKGNINQAGYAFSLVKTYNKEDIKVSKLRIKEWDYYYIGDENFGLALTIADNGYMGLTSASILNFNNTMIDETSNIFWFPLGKTKMPTSSKDGSVKVKKKGYDFNFINEKGKRRLICEIKNFKKKYFYCDISLSLTNPNSMTIVTPFKKPKHFYYNQKINLLKVKGYFVFGKLKYEFKNDAYAVLDWGRGVWTYKNAWYWSSLNSIEDNHLIGFNLGYGFGDTKAASENMVYYDEEAYKLDDVIFDIPRFKNGKHDYLSTWKIYDKRGDVNLTFTPLLDRHAKINAVIVGQDSHQVFGYFKGQIKVENKTINIKRLLGFAEYVKNRW